MSQLVDRNLVDNSGTTVHSKSDSLPSITLRGLLSALYRMSKPTITLLVVYTTWPSIILAHLATRETVLLSWPRIACITVTCLIGTALMSASAAIFNQLIDRKIDEKMVRTRGRPLPQRELSTTAAFGWGLFIAVFSFVLLVLGCNMATALTALAANIFYVGIYTAYLKKRTTQNIVIGGAAGAVGPLIGWAAMTGGFSAVSWALFALIFLWTPPHFWALALKYKDDYRDAGIPMLPVIEGVQHTKFQMFIYSLLLIPNVLLIHQLTGIWGLSSIVNLAATFWFAKLCWDLMLRDGITGTMSVFAYSCAYLFIIFGALGVDACLRI
jgi:protoheme IX farnesyltransferase